MAMYEVIWAAAKGYHKTNGTGVVSAINTAEAILRIKRENRVVKKYVQEGYNVEFEVNLKK